MCPCMTHHIHVPENTHLEMSTQLFQVIFNPVLKGIGMKDCGITDYGVDLTKLRDSWVYNAAGAVNIC